MSHPLHLESERLILRTPRVQDASAYKRLTCDSLELLKPWMPWAQDAPTLQYIEAVVQSAIENTAADTDYHLLMFRRETEEIIGSCGLHRFDLSVPRFEIGYWVGSRFLKQGYATEAVKLLESFCFQELSAKRVELHVLSSNKASQAVVAKAGYSLESVKANYARSLVDGSLLDMLVFAKLA